MLRSHSQSMIPDLVDYKGKKIDSNPLRINNFQRKEMSSSGCQVESPYETLQNQNLGLNEDIRSSLEGIDGDKEPEKVQARCFVDPKDGFLNIYTDQMTDRDSQNQQSKSQTQFQRYRHMQKNRS